MVRFFLFILSPLLVISCQTYTSAKSDGMTVADKKALLHTLATHIKASITDLTETKRTPTDQFVLNTYYPLSLKELEAVKISEELAGSFATTVVDGINCTVMMINLRNEKGESVSLVDTIAYPLYLQRFGLWEYNQELCQHIGVHMQTSSLFSTLTGDIRLKLYMEEGVVELIDIPIAITVKDILP